VNHSRARRLATAAALWLPLLLGACGEDPPPAPPQHPRQDPATPGLYELDPKATVEQMELAGTKKTLAEVAAVKVHLELKKDGTFTSLTTAEGIEFSASGTWESDLDRVLLRTMVENGEKRDPPDEKTGAFRDGAIWFDASEHSQPVVLRKR
jgi:hypothetical protein